MEDAAIVPFVCSLVKSWDIRRSRCLARMVSGLMRAGRLGVAAIGRWLPGKTTDKHRIKAVDRFLGNDAVDLHPLWQGLLALACKRQRVFVLLDWTDLDARHEALVAAVSFGGRALPIAWTTSRKSHYFKSRNGLETSFCLLLKTLVPDGVQLVIVADRGFARASLMRRFDRSRIGYVIRFRRDIHILDGRGSGPVANRMIQLGRTRDLGVVSYGDNAQVQARCVLTFGHGSGRIQPQQPWYLVTNLSGDELSTTEVVGAYKLRMRIEHNFRDHKSLRFGFQLRAVRLSTQDRYDRLLAIAAVAMLLIVLIGAKAERSGLARTFRANTAKTRTHSLFSLGIVLFHRLRLRVVPFRFLAPCFQEDLRG